MTGTGWKLSRGLVGCVERFELRKPGVERDNDVDLPGVLFS
jgi:hypothetical protein